MNKNEIVSLKLDIYNIFNFKKTAEQYENLETLELTFCDLNTIPSCISQLSNLRKLILRSNSISKIENWEAPKNLTELDLSNNNFKDFPCDWAKQNPQVKIILNANPIKEVVFNKYDVRTKYILCEHKSEKCFIPKIWKKTTICSLLRITFKVLFSYRTFFILSIKSFTLNPYLSLPS